MGRIILVDGGGSATRVRLLDEDGAVIGEGRGGPSSLTLGVAQGWSSIRAALAQAGDPGAAPVLSGGFAGARSPQNRLAFREADPLGCVRIEIATDGLAALTGAFAGGPGAILAVGTGITAYARSADGKVHQSSGWGFPVGDEGGGAWIGLQAAQALTNAMDGRRAADSTLFPALRREMGGDFDVMQLWLKGAGPTRFATLAPLVVKQAEAGDALANELLDAAAAAAEQALTAVEDKAGRLGVALLGGLADALTLRLSCDVQARLTPPQGGVLEGAALLAGGSGG